jgi:hypothetical protein
MADDPKSKLIDEFLSSSGAPPESRAILDGFASFLKDKGCFVQPGGLQEQFLEKTTVKDKNKVPIDIVRCLVCGHEEFEVKSQG